MIFAPRSWPSRPGLAMTTLILRATPASLFAAVFASVAALDRPRPAPRVERDEQGNDDHEAEQAAGDDEPQRAEPSVLAGASRHGHLGRPRRRSGAAEHVLWHHRVGEPA